MAKELNTQTTEKIQDQVKKERNIMFLAVRIILVVIAVAVGGYSLYTGVTSYLAAEEYGEKYGELDRQYETLKAEAAAWHEENDSKPDSVDDDGTNVEYKTMYSCQDIGVEVAYLQNIYYRNKELMSDDRQRLNDLVKGAKVWIGAGWDPGQTPIRWEFATWYDATDKAYDVCWECWHEAPSGTMYLIAVQFGRYDGDTNTFKLSSMYQTDFARMLESKGAVEAGDPVEMNISGRTVDQLVSEIMGSGGTGSIPEGDPGTSAGVQQDDQDTSGELAGGPAGGGL